MTDRSGWRLGNLPGELEPPEIRRRLTLHRLQMVGVPLLALIPLLAMLGVFGETREQVDAAGTDLAIAIEYPTRFRYKTIDPIRVAVTNRTAVELDTVTVLFDVEYLSRFSTPLFIPAATDAYVVPLSSVRPGETRHVYVEIQAETYWRHEGWVAATTGGADTVRVPLATIVFP